MTHVKQHGLIVTRLKSGQSFWSPLFPLSTPSLVKAKLGNGSVPQDSISACYKPEWYKNPLPCYHPFRSGKNLHDWRSAKAEKPLVGAEAESSPMSQTESYLLSVQRAKSPGAQSWFLPLSSLVLPECLIFSSLRLLPPRPWNVSDNPEPRQRYSMCWDWFLRNWIRLHHLRTVRMWPPTHSH